MSNFLKIVGDEVEWEFEEVEKLVKEVEEVVVKFVEEKVVVIVVGEWELLIIFIELDKWKFFRKVLGLKFL